MAIMPAIVMYVIPALLGRSYDLKNEVVGPDIFKQEEIEAQHRTIRRYMTTAEYKVVSELSEVADFLDVSGKASLKLKIGATNVNGAGGYLKDTTSFHNKVDLLIKVHYETEIFTIPSEVKPIQNWENNTQRFPATHYIRSILYGGDLIASVQFTTDNDADKESIKAMIQGGLNAKSGSFGAGLSANLKKIQEKVSKKSSMAINYYATVPLDTIPRTIDGLIELVDKFPEQTKKVNNGLGVPLKMELFSLEGLEKNRETYWQSLALADQMASIDEEFNDIRNTKKRLFDWMKTIPPALPLTEKSKIGLFQTKLDDIDKIFSRTIANLDLAHNSSGRQFDDAFNAYKGDEKVVMPDMYVRKLSKLKAEVMRNTKSFETDFGGAQFIHWGADTCSEENKLIFTGVMSATYSRMMGASEIVCMPDEQQHGETVPSGDDDEQTDILPQVMPVTFNSRNKNNAGGSGKLVKCASCRVPGKSSQTTLIGQTECPSGWMQQYQGVLVSSDISQIREDLVCLDSTKQFDDIPKDLEDSTILTEVSASCDSFPCSGGVSSTTAIPCVVCSFTRDSN